MNQLEILKWVLADYRQQGGDLGDVAAATAYVQLHKPIGVGQVNEVICMAVLKQMGLTAILPKPMLTEAPPAVVEPAPAIAASEIITIPEIKVYNEAPAIPEPECAFVEPPASPVPFDPPKPVDDKQADPVEPVPTKTPVPPATPVQTSWLSKLMFWKKW